MITPAAISTSKVLKERSYMTSSLLKHWKTCTGYTGRIQEIKSRAGVFFAIACSPFDFVPLRCTSLRVCRQSEEIRSAVAVARQEITPALCYHGRKWIYCFLLSCHQSAALRGASLHYAGCHAFCSSLPCRY